MSNSRLLSILGKVITKPEREENIVCPDLPPVIAPLITFLPLTMRQHKA